MSRTFAILRAVLIPILLGTCLLCVLIGAVAFLLTPEGLNPGEAVVLRVYLLQNNMTLNTPRNATAIEKERFTVEPNDNANTIGIRLVTQGFIDNGTLFARYVRYEGLDTQLRAGTFFISPGMTIPQIAAELTDPRPRTVRFTVIEGWRMEQIADAITNEPMLDFTGNDFLAVVGAGASIPPEFAVKFGIPPGRSLEGFLYPATYDVPIAASAIQLRNLMLDAFASNVTEQMIRDAAAQGYTMFDIVTLASIVEREAVLATERPQIASVYLNRLEIGQKLDADPTTQYGIANTRDGNWWPQITQADYRLNHAYNTYVINSLPPGPIANPSLSSIRGSIYPADTPYFYFRAACDGSGAHQFSITFEEHVSKGC